MASIDVLGSAKDVVVRYKSDNASKCIALQLLLRGVVLSGIIFRKMFLVGVTMWESLPFREAIVRNA